MHQSFPTTAIAAVVLTALAALSGCVVAPLPARPVAVVQPPAAYPPGYGPPPGVVYVQPTYAVPAPGYVWLYHPRFDWGWHHPQMGWHRGWR